MELDELKEHWNELDRKLDVSIKLNTRAVRQSLLGKTDAAMRRLSLFIGFELVINGVVLILLGSFIADHLTEARFLLPALALELFAIALVALPIHQLVAIRSIDYGAPIVSIQKKAARLRIQRISTTKWTLIVAPLLWLPLLIVSMKGLFGLDAYRLLSTEWLAANVLFGLAFIALMMWISRRFGKEMSRWPLMQRLMDDIAGRSLNAATAFMNEVSGFEAEAQ